jgi:hypothetical protein
MSDSLSEIEGCDLLARLFAARGYRLARNVIFREYGVTFHIDGWDAAARVGFEYLTSEDDDHEDLTLTGYKTLMAAQQRGDLSLFIIDEVEPMSAAELTASAHEFLDEVAAAARARTRRDTARRGSASTKTREARTTARRKTVTGKTAAKKPAAAKLSARKLSGPGAEPKKPAARKPAPKRPAAKPAAAARPAAKGRGATGVGRKTKKGGLTRRP